MIALPGLRLLLARARGARWARGLGSSQPTVQARFWLLSLPAVQFSPGCRPAAAAEKFPACGELFQYGQYRGTKGWAWYCAQRLARVARDSCIALVKRTAAKAARHPGYAIAPPASTLTS
jgi:hypothetical protein